MGGCFSSGKGTHEFNQRSPPTAKVVSVNGDLKEFQLPITVSQVLIQLETSNSWFICISDSLCFDELITASKMEDQLQANELYFALPLSKLEKPISASYMASLAVKASMVLQNSSSDIGKKYGHRRNRMTRISPAVFSGNCSSEQNETISSSSSSNVYDHEITIGFNGPRNKKQRYETRAPGILRSGSTKKSQGYASKRAFSAVGSFRFRLSTIYEVTTAF